MKKILFLIFVFFSVFIVYDIFYFEKINYVSIGDSIAEGVSPFGEVLYSYSDYIVDHLKFNNKLGFYSNSFVKSNYTINDLYNDIYNNRTIINNNKTDSINYLLRESNILTLSVGINDFITVLNINNEMFIDNYTFNKYKLDNILSDYELLLNIIKKYAKNDVYILGIYNPIPYNKEYRKTINKLVNYYNNKLNQLCKKNSFIFLDYSDIECNYEYYFDNNKSLNFNNFGHNKIYNIIKKYL